MPVRPDVQLPGTVETGKHSFLHYVVSRYRSGREREFWVDYRKTPKNEPAGRVFVDVGLQEKASTDGVASFVLPNGGQIPDERVVSIDDLVGSPASQRRRSR